MSARWRVQHENTIQGRGLLNAQRQGQPHKMFTLPYWVTEAFEDVDWQHAGAQEAIQVTVQPPPPPSQSHEREAARSERLEEGGQRGRRGLLWRFYWTLLARTFPSRKAAASTSLHLSPPKIDVPNRRDPLVSAHPAGKAELVVISTGRELVDLFSMVSRCVPSPAHSSHSLALSRYK